MTQITDMAVEILQKTRDGNALHTTDLYLIQCAVNDHLIATGIDEFKKLHKLVTEDKYKIDERWTE